MQTRTIGLGLVIAVVAATAVAAGGNTESDKKPRRGPAPHERLAEELELTTEQREQLAQLREQGSDYRQERHEERGGGRPNQDQISQLWLAEEIDPSQVEELLQSDAGESDQARAEHRQFVAQQVAALHAILTPEQRAKLLELQAERGFDPLRLLAPPKRNHEQRPPAN